MMFRADAAFLSAAVEIGDAAVARQLLAAYPLVQAASQLADGDDVVVPPSRIPLQGPAVDGARDNPLIAAALARIATALAQPAITRDLVGGMAELGEALFHAGHLRAALPVLELVQRLGTQANLPAMILDSAFRHYLLLTRGLRPGAVTKHLPFALAMQARRARCVEFVGVARYLDAERLMIAGNLPAAQKRAEQLLPWAMQHGSVMVEGAAYNVLAAIHGRCGRFAEAAQFASRAIAAHFPPSYRYSALALLGSAFVDLGMHREARAALELAAAGPFGLQRVMSLAGLVDILAREGDRVRFERLYRYLREDPLLYGGSRIAFYRDSGRAWASFGEMQCARADFNRALELARDLGMGLEIFRTEEDLRALEAVPTPKPPTAPKAPGSRDAHPQLLLASSRVLELRSERDALVAAALP